MRVLRAEAGRWLQRWDIVALVIIIPAFSAWAFISGSESASQQAAGMGVGGTDDIRRALVGPYLFPASVQTALGGSLWVSLATAYVAAVVVGSEFPWGTIRQLALATTRPAIVLCKWAFVMAIGGAMIVMLVVLGVALPFLAGTGRGDGPLWPVALGALAAVGSMAFYGTASLAVAVFSRSPTTPILALAVIVVGQSLVIGLPIWSGALEQAPGLLPGSAAGILATAAQASAGIVDTSSLPAYLRLPWPLAAVILATWVVGPLIAAIWKMRQMDITS